MKKLLPLLAFSILLLVPVGAQNAFAGAPQNCFLLNFEGLQDSEGVLNFYDGGFGSGGTGPGPNFGVSFDLTTLAFIDSDQGGTGDFANEPSPNTAIQTSAFDITMTLSQEIRSVSWFHVAQPGGVIVTFFDSASPLAFAGVAPTVPPLIVPGGGDPTGTLDNWGLGSFDAGSNLIKKVNFLSGGVSFYDNIEICSDGDQIIGGEIIPIETTSLILAGAQSASWMIPVLASITGIGLFFLRRNYNN